MKSLKLEIVDDDLLFFKHGVFKVDDELVVFSLDEYSKFKKVMMKYLMEANQIVEESRNNKSQHGPTVDAQRILNWIRKTEEEIEKLNQTDIQKDLLSYK